jgi:hypothetical protein
MKKYSTNILVVLFVILLPFIGYAQTNKDSAMNIVKELCNKYNTSKYLSFKVDYSYRNEDNPEVLQDSLAGQVKINENNYHIVLGNTETIRNNNYNVMLFKEDTLMYISKPASSNLNPLSVMDSLLNQISNMDVSLTKTRWQNIITINYPEGGDYKKAQLFIDIKSGYLVRIKYIVRIALLINPSDRAAVSNNSIQNNWALIESAYSQYQQSAFNDSEFDDKRYFIKDGKEYKPTEAYKQYKIFTASPGL